MTPARLVVTTVDYHTGGEPFRIVTGGAGPLLGRTILEKRRYARENLDHIRRMLVFEPRGHADMYGCFVTEPEDTDADLACVFFHNEGYSTACGHGTIALVTWALESGTIAARTDEVKVTVDVPSGRLPAIATRNGADVRSVRFRNVPSFVFLREIPVELGYRTVLADVSYGGAFYASVDASRLGLALEPGNLNRFIELGRRVKKEIEAGHDVVHPEEPELRDIYGVIFFERQAGDGSGPRQRNVAIFADGEVDRSPCGSGTSARLALLDATGELKRGERLTHTSIVGSEFTASVVGDALVGGKPAVITEVEGSAHLTGYHQFVLEETDGMGEGFLLR